MKNYGNRFITKYLSEKKLNILIDSGAGVSARTHGPIGGNMDYQDIIGASSALAVPRTCLLRSFNLVTDRDQYGLIFDDFHIFPQRRLRHNFRSQPILDKTQNSGMAFLKTSI